VTRGETIIVLPSFLLVLFAILFVKYFGHSFTWMHLPVDFNSKGIQRAKRLQVLLERL